MAEADDPKAEASAEKAYAAAAEAVGEEIAKLDDQAIAPEDEANAAPVEFPAKPKRTRKPREEAVSEPAAAPVVAEVAPPAPVATPKPRRPRVTTPAAAKSAKARPAVKRAPPAPVSSAPVKAIKASVAKPKPAYKAVSKPAKASAIAAPTPSSFLAQLKEIPMDVTTSIKDAVNGAQEKAKEAYTKGTAFAGEYTEFAKGNVEAIVESGKILAAGLQEIGNGFVAESKSAFETATADVKALTAVKSPTDFFKLQTDVLRRNFDTAVAYTSKTGEAMFKLTNDAFAPISGRVSLAVEKVKKAA